MARKTKINTWHQLGEEKCPKCSAGLMKDLFTGGFVGCACGFNLDVETKDILVKRDELNKKENG